MCYFDYNQAVEAAYAVGLGVSALTQRTRQSDGAVFWVLS